MATYRPSAFEQGEVTALAGFLRKAVNFAGIMDLTDEEETVATLLLGKLDSFLLKQKYESVIDTLRGKSK